MQSRRGGEDGSVTQAGGTGPGDQGRILEARRRESQDALLTDEVGGERARRGGPEGLGWRRPRTAGLVCRGPVEFDRILGHPVPAVLVFGGLL